MQQPNEENTIGSDHLNHLGLDELPTPGIGADVIDEIYQQGGNAQSAEAANADRVENSYSKNKAESNQELKDIVKALTGLLNYLNSTSKGTSRNKIKNKLRPVAHLGNNKIAVKNIILDDGSFAKTHTYHLPNGQNIYFNIKSPTTAIPNSMKQSDPLLSVSNTTRSTTIPPHLIPLGPDGYPLLNPDGTALSKNSQQLGSFQYSESISNRFPYLTSSTSAPPPTASPSASQSNENQESQDVDRAEEEEEEEHTDMFSRMISTIRDMPMDTKRHMLANMMFGIPMAAVTMAAAGVPDLFIAPLATVIPGID